MIELRCKKCHKLLARVDSSIEGEIEIVCPRCKIKNVWSFRRPKIYDIKPPVNFPDGTTTYKGVKIDYWVANS